MAMLSPSDLLDAWEAGTRRHPIDRAILLLSLSADRAPDALPDQPLGDMNRALLAFRRARYGDRLEVWADCDECGERMSLELSAGDLPPPPHATSEVAVAGHRFRRPTSRDLAALAGSRDVAAAARELCRTCALEPDALPEDEALDELISEVEAALDEADPWADLTLLAACPACGHEAALALDLSAILWDEIAAEAHQLVDEVHMLAAAYGWSEREILGMSAARRGAYIARLAA